MEIARRSANPDCIGWSLHVYGRVLAQSDVTLATAAFEQAMSSFRSVGSRFNLALSLAEWSKLKHGAGDLSMAAAGLIDLIDLLRASGNRAQLSQALRIAASVLCDAGALDEAAVVLLARRGLPEIPTMPTDELAEVPADDEELLADISHRRGDEWPRLVLRARATTESQLLAATARALADIAQR